MFDLWRRFAMVSDADPESNFLPPPTPQEVDRYGFQFSFQPAKEDRYALNRSSSMPSVLNLPPSLPTPRQPLQQLRMNGHSGRASTDTQQKGGHHNVQRSYSLKGASNLPKETHLLRKKMDRMLQTFHETVVEYDKSQQTRLQQLQNENEKLRKANSDLEVENLTYFKELEDCEEHISELEEQRKALTEKLSNVRKEYAEIATLKDDKPNSSRTTIRCYKS